MSGIDGAKGAPPEKEKNVTVCHYDTPFEKLIGSKVSKITQTLENRGFGEGQKRCQNFQGVKKT